MKSIDVKSLLIGLLFGLLVTALLAASPGNGSPGSYTLTGARDVAWIIDTRSGELWALHTEPAAGTVHHWPDGSSSYLSGPRVRYTGESR